MSTQTVPYVLNNDEPTANAMHDHLSTQLDRFTRARLVDAGITRDDVCWEIGAGNGSVAAWMCEQVGQGRGYVLATDINPRHVRSAGTVMAVKTHDVAAEQPPVDELNVIHARLVFAHLPTRRETLAVVADALAPGGALVIEDCGQWTSLVQESPVPDAAGIYDRYQRALMTVLASFGNDSTWALSTLSAMRAIDLVDVQTATYAQSWKGGTAGCLLPIVVAKELRAKLLDRGATEEDLDRLPEIMTHPETVVLGNPLLSTIGRRPH